MNADIVTYNCDSFSLCFSHSDQNSELTIDNTAMSSETNQDPKALGKVGKCELFFVCVMFVLSEKLYY